MPQLYYVLAPTNWPVAFGLGIYAPYGLSIDWGQTGPFDDVSQKGYLEYLTANPVVAWKITPQVSVAGGLTVNYAKASFTQGIGVLPGDKFYFQGDDTEVGFNAGVFWQPMDQLAFGVNYHSMTTMHAGGHSTFSPYANAQPTTASLNFPAECLRRHLLPADGELEHRSGR